MTCKAKVAYSTHNLCADFVELLSLISPLTNMPRRYASKRRPYRRSRPRRMGRKRFSRKRFARSTPNVTRVRGTTIARNASVKLTYTKEFLSTITATTHLWSATSFPFGSPAYTFPANSTTASICFLGSHFCTPLGNPSSTPGYLTEDYPSGIVDWATFYEEAICYGSSISVQMMPSGANAVTTPDVRYVLIAIASQSSGSSDLTGPNIGSGDSTKAKLDVLDYEDLSSYPGAKSGYIRSSFSGVTRLKAFRKTKSMLGLKDLKDNQSLRMVLPTSSNLNGGANLTANGDELCWLWYFRLFPFSTAAESAIMYTFRINYYAQLQSRTIILQETASAS